MVNDKIESDQAKEERLREKLKRKAEQLHHNNKDNDVQGKSKEQGIELESNQQQQQPKQPRKKKSKTKGRHKSKRDPHQQRERERTINNTNHHHHSNMDNHHRRMRQSPSSSYHGGAGRNNAPLYRDGYDYNRGVDWRAVGAPHYPPGGGYDPYHRRDGYRDGGGWYHNNPYDGYRNGPPMDGPYGYDYRGGANGNGERQRSESKGRSNNRSTARTSSVSRSRSRSDSYSRSSSHSRSRSRSSSSNSRSMSSDNSRDSRGRSRSVSNSSRSPSSDRSLSKSVSRSKSPSEQGGRGASSKRNRSDSHVSENSNDRHDKKKNRADKEDRHSNVSRDNEDDNNGSITKDQRTIFVSQLVMKANERDIKRFFRKTLGCKVNDVQLLRDKRTGRHKGCAYVELGRLEDIPTAVAATGKQPDFQRFPILVKASEAEKNYGIDGPSANVSLPIQVPVTGLTKRIEAQKVYIGSIDRNVTQAQLYAIFSQFGDLEKVTLQVDTATGMSKGFAFLSFKDPKVANLAIQAMSGQVLAGRPLRTGWANLNSSVPNLEEVSSTEFPDDAVARIGKVNEVLQRLNTTGLAPLPGLTLIPGMGQVDRSDLLKELEASSSTNPSSSITNAAEAALNAAFGTVSSIPSSVPQVNETSKEASVMNTSEEVSNTNDNDPKQVKGQPSKNILVRNMFDKDEETEEGWEEDIKLDFEEESSKHGKIVAVKVMSKEVGGKIYASFETVEGAKACAENLAGRWFDKRQLKVEFVSDGLFADIV